MKKKLYNQPIVELTQLMPGTIVLAGSPGPTPPTGISTGDPLSGGGD